MVVGETPSSRDFSERVPRLEGVAPYHFARGCAALYRLDRDHSKLAIAAGLWSDRVRSPANRETGLSAGRVA